MISEYIESLGNENITHYEIGKPVETRIVKFSSYEFEENEPTIVAKIEDFIASGKNESIEGLVFGVWKEAYEVEPPYLNLLIENKNKFPNLKYVFFGDITSEDCEISWIIQTNYNEFLKQFPHLEIFGVQGGTGLGFGTFSLPKVKEFILRSGGTNAGTIQDIINSNTFQTLERLEIWFGTDEYGGTCTEKEFKGLLELDMPELKHLAFMNSDSQDEVVKCIAESELLKQIETLDVSMGILTDKGGELLLSGAFDHLNHIKCEWHFMSEELTEKINNHFNEKITISQPEEADEYDDEVYRYVAVGE